MCEPAELSNTTTNGEKQLQLLLHHTQLYDYPFYIPRSKELWITFIVYSLCIIFTTICMTMILFAVCVCFVLYLYKTFKCISTEMHPGVFQLLSHRLLMTKWLSNQFNSYLFHWCALKNTNLNSGYTFLKIAGGYLHVSFLRLSDNVPMDTRVKTLII